MQPVCSERDCGDLVVNPLPAMVRQLFAVSMKVRFLRRALREHLGAIFHGFFPAR